MIKSGSLRGEIIEYPDGIGCTIWYPLGDDADDVGICFDFLFGDIDDLIALLNEMKSVEPERYIDDSS